MGIGLGLLFLAREGISFAMLKHIPRVSDDELEDDLEEEIDHELDELDREREAARAAAVNGRPGDREPTMASDTK